MHISTTLSLTSDAVLEISAKSAGAAFSRGATLSRQLCLFEYVADCRGACLLVKRMHPLTLNSPPVPTRSTNTYTIQSLRSKRFVQSNAKKTIARFWNEKIERFTYKQKFTIFRISFNDIKGFLKKKVWKMLRTSFKKIKTKYYKNNSKN